MANRNQAQAILIEAREILSTRLNDLILERGDAFLDDARGDSYMDEIGSVYDQVVGRLTQVNTMIANLPSESSAPAFSASKENDHSDAGSESAPATFQDFVKCVSTGDLKSAAPMLCSLLNLDEEQAKSCTEAYSDRLASYPDTLQRTMQLRVDIAQDQDNQVIMFLYEAFGLSSVDAIRVLHHLKKNFGQAA